ncbi:Hypothetical protein PBC10988_12850 [Planctomycetales bacterium 10988]|nr:Hypothetical protein PBC10988_12850 [Planctomycetales bacterium 10988]
MTCVWWKQQAWAVVAMVGLLMTGGLRAEIPATATLVDAESTLFFTHAVNMPEFREKADNTNLGKLFADESMKPFTDHLEQLIWDEWTARHSEPDVTFEDLVKLPSGEAAMILSKLEDGTIGSSMILDVTDRKAEVDDFLKKAENSLIAEGAKKSTSTVSGIEIVFYDVPAPETDGLLRKAGEKGSLYYFYAEDCLAMATNKPLLTAIIERLKNPEKPFNLEDDAEFSRIMKACAAQAGDLNPDARGFVRPFPLAEASRAERDEPWDEYEDGPDPLRIAREAGFFKLEAIGGYLNLDIDRTYDTMWRAMVIAKPPYEKGMRMMKTPAGEMFKLPGFVPADVASVVTVFWDVKEAFEGFASVFDAYIEEPNAFEDLIESQKDEEYGTGIDMREDLAGLTGNQALFIGDVRLPVTTNSRQNIMAIQTTDPERLAANIAKSFKGDPNTKTRTVNGHLFYEVSDEPPPPTPEDPNPKPLPPTGVAVAFGHLLISSHIPMMEKILQYSEGEQSSDWKALGPDDTEYNFVMKLLDQKVEGPESFRGFDRVTQSVQPTYELIKQGNLRDDDSLLGRILQLAIDDEDRFRKIKGELLPDYEVVRRFLGPGGFSGKTEDWGWSVFGFTLRK